MPAYKESFTNLTIAILTIISEEKANYGYTICTYIEYVGMACSHQQIYRELRKFTDRGYLNRRSEPVFGKPDRQVYTITPLGKQIIEDLQIDSISKISSFDLACAFPKPRFINQAVSDIQNEMKSIEIRPFSEVALAARQSVLSTKLSVLSTLESTAA